MPLDHVLRVISPGVASSGLASESMLSFVPSYLQGKYQLTFFLCFIRNRPEEEPCYDSPKRNQTIIVQLRKAAWPIWINLNLNALANGTLSL